MKKIMVLAMIIGCLNTPTLFSKLDDRIATLEKESINLDKASALLKKDLQNESSDLSKNSVSAAEEIVKYSKLMNDDKLTKDKLSTLMNELKFKTAGALLGGKKVLDKIKTIVTTIKNAQIYGEIEAKTLSDDDADALGDFFNNLQS